jgi:hypothetical protein
LYAVTSAKKAPGSDMFDTAVASSTRAPVAIVTAQSVPLPLASAT